MISAPSFQEKSKQSLLSAQLLIKEHIYCTSVHCSFYSCIQTMFHVLHIKKKVSKEKFIVDAKYNGLSTQRYAVKLIENELVGAKKYSEYKWFQKYFPELRHLREKADYSDEFILQGEVQDAFNKANAINSLVNKI